jgi:hypothetical protein
MATAGSTSLDFWERAPDLFDLAGSISESLSAADISDSIVAQVKTLADQIPQTPEPLSDMDPYLRSALLTGVIHSLRAVDQSDRSELRVTVERVRQALRDLLDERPVWRAGPKDAAVWLREQGIPLSDLTVLLSASETSVRRWANREDDTAPSADNADRVMVVAKIVNHLRHAMTSRGAVQWMQRPHPELDDRAPIEQLNDPASYRLVIHLASGTRSVVAT